MLSNDQLPPTVRSLLGELYGHVLNTVRGLLLEGPQQNKGRKFFTSLDELDGTYFDKFTGFEADLPTGVPLRVLLHAHGGLVSEETALDYASDHLNWWHNSLQVFPFFMIWETGAFETLLEGKRALEGAADQQRGLFAWQF